MKYSILGFSQKSVLELQEKQGDKIKKLDITDLLILRDVADFMNRSKIIKYTINDKIYFSVQYSTILEDLPIIDIKKQALRDRLDKLVLLGLLEKEVVKNEQGSFAVFRIGKKYELLVYHDDNNKGDKNEGGVYQTTHPCVVDYTPKNTSTKYSSTCNKEIEDKSSIKKELTWRENFDMFVAEVNKAKTALLADNEFKKKQEMYYPNLNYELTLQKMVEDYWCTEYAWNKRKKRKKKGEGINMLTTLKRAFSQSCNRVYKSRTYGQQQLFSTYTAKKMSDRASDYLHTLKVDIVHSSNGVDYLKDGTYIENGKRYYRTRLGTQKEIPIGLIARPNEDWEYDRKTMIWVQDESKETLDDMLF